MTTFLRHGGESHVVRPDRVYRTGVLTSIVGYQPQADVQAVARAFTQGPPSGMQLSGLGASGPNFFQRIVLRIKAAKARKRAERFAVAASSVQGPPAPQAPGPTPQMAAQQLSPDQAGRAHGVFMLVQPAAMHPRAKDIAQAARIMAGRRNASLYWAG